MAIFCYDETVISATSSSKSNNGIPFKDKPNDRKVTPMNGISGKTVQIVDLANETNLPGKELSRAHNLYCTLRDEGFNESDIERLVQAPSKLLGYILAFLREEVPLCEIPDELANLDRHPGIRRDKKKKISLFTDTRLGTWLTDWSGDKGIRIGGKYIDILRPSGLGLQNGDFFARTTLRPHRHQKPPAIDLNAQAAKWFFENHFDTTRNFFELTGHICKSDEWQNDMIFFLGTLWTVNEVPHAMAIVSNEEGNIFCRPEAIPNGDWPDNCYIAVLVDDPDMFKDYK